MNKTHFTPAQKIGKESTISFIGMGYGQFIRYMFTVILARLVGVGYLGLYSIGNSVVTLATVFAKAGLDIGIMRFISGKDVTKEQAKIKEDVYSTLKIGTIISLIVMVIMIFLAEWLSNNVFHEGTLLKTIIIVNSFAIPFITINLISIHATQGFQLLKYKVFIDNILNPTLLMVTMLFAYFCFSNELTIIIPLLATSIFCSLVSTAFLKKFFKINIFYSFKIKPNTEILKYSMPIMFTVILGTLLHWLDIIMLGFYTNPETVGLYHPVVRTAGMQNSILIAFSGIFSPMFSKYFAQDNKVNMLYIYRLVTRWILTILIPIFIFIVLFSKKIMLLFGPEFLPVSNVLILLSVGTSLFALFGISGSILVVSGYQKLNMINTLIATILNVVLNIVLIPKYGILGAAWATVIALSFIAIIRIIEARILLKMNPFYLKDVKALIAGLLTFFTARTFKPYIYDMHTVVTIIFAVLFISLTYLLVMILLKLDEDDKDFLKSIIFLKNEVIKNRK